VAVQLDDRCRNRDRFINLIKEIALETIVCIQCGDEFEVSGINREKLSDRGFDLPKRCPDCRRKKSKFAVDESNQRRRDKKKHYHQKYDQF
jgi:hypothetical protein